MRRLLLSLVLAFSNADISLQNVLAPRTTSGSALNHDATPIPTPTEQPCASYGPELKRRDAESIAPNICGWFSGVRNDVWTYDNPTYTCYWQSDFHVIGSQLPVQTSCVEQVDLSSCTACSGDDVLKCSSINPFCATFFYGSDYSAYMCATETGISYTLQSTPDGFTAPIAFPVYTGKRGISTGIQYPIGYPSESRTITTSGYSTPPSTDLPSSDSPSADLPSSTPTNSFLDPSTTSSKGNSSGGPSGSSKSTPVGAIVGGVIGGVFVIAFVVGIILFFVLRSRRNSQNNLAPPLHQPPQNGLGDPQANPYPPMQQYYPPPGNPQGVFVPQGNPTQPGFAPGLQQNQHTPPQQHPANPELDSHQINQQGFNQGVVAHIQPNQHTPSPLQPNAPELHGNHGISPSELPQNQSAIPQQQPTAPELYGNQPLVNQGASPSELYQPPNSFPQQQPTQPELESRPANQAYHGSNIHEAP
ncbi:hypothetical protein V490_05293 [Pseudogymnoascus sp. VKM F-3557]|nr:hypothetical protein V490_05293 [Pseudogymnoascus sp. VKM F-3557]